MWSVKLAGIAVHVEIEVMGRRFSLPVISYIRVDQYLILFLIIVELYSLFIFWPTVHGF